jgi:hypothetical protein
MNGPRIFLHVRPCEDSLRANLASPRRKGFETVPGACSGAKLILLPKYSPDLDPIEQVSPS